MKSIFVILSLLVSINAFPAQSLGMECFIRVNDEPKYYALAYADSEGQVGIEIPYSQWMFVAAGIFGDIYLTAFPNSKTKTMLGDELTVYEDDGDEVKFSCNYF